MSMPRRNVLPAIGCGGFFLLLAALIWPRVDSGLMDEWSIFRTAELLARTGHILYNGWESPIQGWLLYWGAAFFHVFGYSFNVARASVLVVSTLSVMLMQRLGRRAGLSPRLSMLGALTLAACPVFLAAAVSFTTDVPGLFAVLVCLDGCAAAVACEDDTTAAGWLVWAALSNCVLGNARQIAWLGVLVIVPSALWLVRRRRRVLLPGAAAWLVGCGVVWLTLRWFAHQPFILPESLERGALNARAVANLLRAVARLLLDLALLCLPLTLALLPAMRRAGRWTLAAIGGVWLLWLVYFLRLRAHGYPTLLLAPFAIYADITPQTAENTFTFTTIPIHGPPPLALGTGFRLGLTLVTLLALGAVIAALSGWWSARGAALPSRGAAPSGSPAPGTVTRHAWLVLTLPYVVAYVGLLLPRAVFWFLYDRYLLLLLPMAIVPLAWLLARQPRARAERAAVVVLVFVAGYSVLTLHDAFATYRANLRVVDELRAAGAPRVDIDGGWEYDHTTELMLTDHVLQPGIRLRDGSLLKAPTQEQQTVCSMSAHQMTPHLTPRYTVAYPGSPCVPVPGLPAVQFWTWLPPWHRSAYPALYDTHAARLRQTE